MLPLDRCVVDDVTPLVSRVLLLLPVTLDVAEPIIYKQNDAITISHLLSDLPNKISVFVACDEADRRDFVVSNIQDLA